MFFFIWIISPSFIPPFLSLSPLSLHASLLNMVVVFYEQSFSLYDFLLSINQGYLKRQMTTKTYITSGVQKTKMPPNQKVHKIVELHILNS